VLDASAPFGDELLGGPVVREAACCPLHTPEELGGKGVVVMQCRRSESNRHAPHGATDFESAASACSATSAF
jgi:hypothetical protein